MEPQQKIILPNLPLGRPLFAFEMNGNTMSPVFKNDEVLICQASSIKEVKQGKYYVIETETQSFCGEAIDAIDAIILKQKITKDIFDDGFIIIKNDEITAVWKIIRRVETINND